MYLNTGTMETNNVLLCFAAVDCRMMWAAGAVAAMSSITFPAVSALVSRTADADQQGRLIGTNDNDLKIQDILIFSLLS